MAFDHVIFPVEAASLRAKSSWATIVTETRSGAESRASLWADARRKYVCHTTNMTLANWILIENHFNGRRGRARSFPIYDRTRYTATAEPFGTGDGSSTIFQLVIENGDSGNAYVREIYKPVGGSVTIYDNAVLKTEATHYVINYTTGVLTWVTAPLAGHVLTWTGQFLVPVRYDVDELDPNLFVWSANGQQIVSGPDIPMIEVRDIA